MTSTSRSLLITVAGRRAGATAAPPGAVSAKVAVAAAVPVQVSWYSPTLACAIGPFASKVPSPVFALPAWLRRLHARSAPKAKGGSIQSVVAPTDTLILKVSSFMNGFVPAFSVNVMPPRETVTLPVLPMAKRSSRLPCGLRNSKVPLPAAATHFSV